MYKKIFKAIKKYDNIVIVRHIGIDPDAMASQIALRNSIKLTFPNKNVYAIGNGTVRFNFMGYLDKNINLTELSNVLLIVLDTPDKKRIDWDPFEYNYSIKIDHHPFIEEFCDIELIDDIKSSASEMVYELISDTKLIMNNEIAKNLYIGIIADTNRFLFNNSTSKTFLNVANLIKNYDIDITECYKSLYKRPFNEFELLGYMISNMKITDNGVGFIKVTNEILAKLGLDTASSGNLVNEFNNIDEILTWVVATEDIKNSCIKISMRSMGPIINKIAENYNGGGHKLACGAKVPSFEEVDLLINDLDELCKKYIESSDEDENY